MEWLLQHPQDPAAAAAAAGGAAPGMEEHYVAGYMAGVRAVLTEEQELGVALESSLAAAGISLASLAPQPATAGTAVGTSAAGAQDGAQAGGSGSSGEAVNPPAPLPGPAQMVEGAVAILCRSPAGTFAMGDLLVTLCSKEEGAQRAVVVGQLLQSLASADPGSASEPVSDSGPAAESGAGGGAAQLLMSARLLLTLFLRDPPSRELAMSQGLMPQLLGQLDVWMKKYTAAVQLYETLDAGDGTPADLLQPEPSAATAAAPANFLAKCRDVTKKVRYSLGKLGEKVFGPPVDAKLIPDYYRVIPKPISISQIEAKLDGPGAYTSPEEFADDFRLVWSNCKVYNSKGTWVDKLGEVGEAAFLAAWASSGLGGPLDKEAACACLKHRLQVPVWVEAALLIIECMANSTPKELQPARPAAAAPVAPAAASAPAAAQLPASIASPSPTTLGPATADMEAVVGGPGSSGSAAENPAPAAAPGPAAPASATTAAAGDAPTAAAAPAATAVAAAAAGGAGEVGSLRAGLQEVLRSWRPCGLLTEEEQGRALRLCIQLTQHLHR